MDVSIHHDPWAPEGVYDDLPDRPPTNHAEDADSVKALKKLLGRKALNAHNKRVNDAAA